MRVLQLTLLALLLPFPRAAHAQCGLGDPGFEAGSYSLGLPTTAGSWSGDFAQLVGAEQGVTPFDFWYRDPAAGGAFFNLSNGLGASFFP